MKEHEIFPGSKDWILKGGPADLDGQRLFLSRTMDGLRAMDDGKDNGMTSLRSAIHWVSILQNQVAHEIEKRDFMPPRRWKPWPADPHAPNNFNNHPGTNINKWREAVDKAIRQYNPAAAALAYEAVTGKGPQSFTKLHEWAKKLHDAIVGPNPGKAFTEISGRLFEELNNQPKMKFSDIVDTVEQAFKDHLANGPEVRSGKMWNNIEKHMKKSERIRLMQNDIASLRQQLVEMQKRFEDHLAKNMPASLEGCPKFEAHTGLTHPTDGKQVYGHVHGLGACIAWYSAGAWHVQMVGYEIDRVADIDLTWYKKIS